MPLRISSELHERLLAEAAASPDQEICGLLVGETAVERIIPAINVAADASTAFEIDPATMFAAIRAERAGQGRLLGYYHSHPKGPPTASIRDAKQAVADGRIWLIIGDGQIAAWRKNELNIFNVIEIQITR